MDTLVPPPPPPPPEPPKKARREVGAMRMVRVGKWTGKPSKNAMQQVTVLLERYFLTEKVWHRKEHSAVVVAVRENTDNTAIVEEFRFNRPMESRFVFSERKDGGVDVELRPLEVL